MLGPLLASLAWAPSANGPAAPARAKSSERCCSGVRCQAYNPEVGGLTQEESAQSRPEGSHGTGYRFMPVSALGDTPSPVLLPIAGAHPGLTVEQLAAPQPLPMPEQGEWIYHRLVGDALPTGFVALPGSEQLTHCPDSVAVVCTCASLGLELADGKEHDILAIIDRSDPSVFDSSQHSPQDFYALADETGKVHIRWIEALPSSWRVVGRLLYAQMPYVKKPNAAGGFAEFSDDFEF